MHWTGPERFALAFDPTRCTVTQPHGGRTFRGLATSALPKVYVIVHGGAVIYVGVTRQSVSARLRLGWVADGRAGYHGYRWRHALTDATMFVWYHQDPDPDQPNLEAETVEAEVVYLVRATGQWPEYQTEIHFHPSTSEHRALAQSIIAIATSSALGP